MTDARHLAVDGPPAAPRPRIAVAQLGARRHYAIPTMLHRAGLLDGFYTDLFARPAWVAALKRWTPERARPAVLRRFLARQVIGVPDEKVHTCPLFGLGRLLRRARAKTPGQTLRAFARSNAAFGRILSARGFGRADTVYAFNGAAVELFRYAKGRGMRTILEQTAAPVIYDERLLAEERRRWPAWERGETSPDNWRPLAEREVDEWTLADLILCGSQYVADAVRDEGGPATKCVVVPYGTNVCPDHPTPHQPRAHGPLRVLFVGTLQLRKGIQYLAEAARLLDRADVTIRAVGPVAISRDATRALAEVLHLAGPVPRSQVRHEYESADVLVLPSLSEGSANVCYEALAAGLPVVTTPNAGSVVRDGIDGFVIPIRDSRAIADRLARLAAAPSLVEQMSRNAIARVREFTWERYQERLLSAILGCDQRSPAAAPALPLV